MHHLRTPGLRERKKRRTRQALATAALRLFAERGYEETTIADIAAAAEVSPRTFFAYFPSKEDVIFAEIDDRLAEVRDRLARRTPGETTLEAIRQSVVNVLEALVNEHGEYGAVQVRLVLERPALQARALQRIHQTQQEVALRIRDLCPALDEIDAVIVSGIAVGAMQSVLTHCRQHGLDPGTTRAALDRALMIMESGLGAVPALNEPGR
ncbi:DNA-binding transcriptional regulator, AcrR family [Thermomonospora echinospora]|uniref:DNA-binding transcriptional regulator, AcrR family n=1 Tax=Thermomonospora echinospora TaxID=1992 RepID=A0A1H6DL86_9ACTN|nr:TetR family transcriptional regulator [Thermomonospora echinospora]SEG85901.1 DNA-binding transcriptional regulator, AcrR family [Thermomonospora echinospora]